MTVYAKKATKEQRAWLKHYEQTTGFEPMAQEDIDSGARTFAEVARQNIKWYEDHTSDAYLSVCNFPGQDDEPSSAPSTSRHTQPKEKS